MFNRHCEIEVNEQIQELLKLSTYDVLGVKQVDQKQFAELLIRKCVDLVNDDDNAFDILKHFGFEE